MATKTADKATAPEATKKARKQRTKGPSNYRVVEIKSIRFHNDALAATEGNVPDLNGYLQAFANKFGLKIRERKGKNASYSTATFETEASLNKASKVSGPRMPSKDSLIERLAAAEGKTVEQIRSELAQMKVTNGAS